MATGPALETSLPLDVSRSSGSDGKGKQQQRPDGRRANALRPIFLNVGFHSQANGSAYLEAKGSKLFCSVYGPRQTGKEAYSEQAKLKCGLRYTPFARPGVRSGERDDDVESQERSMLLRQALAPAVLLDKYPKAVIDVQVLVVESDGDPLAHAISCASLALADAGIEMFDLVAGCSAVSAVAPARTLLDPTWAEYGARTGVLDLGYMCSLSEVTQLRQGGSCSQEEARAMIDQCIDGCSQVHALMRQALAKSIKAKQ